MKQKLEEFKEQRRKAKEGTQTTQQTETTATTETSTTETNELSETDLDGVVGGVPYEVGRETYEGSTSSSQETTDMHVNEVSNQNQSKVEVNNQIEKPHVDYDNNKIIVGDTELNYKEVMKILSGNIFDIIKNNNINGVNLQEILSALYDFEQQNPKVAKKTYPMMITGLVDYVGTLNPGDVILNLESTLTKISKAPKLVVPSDIVEKYGIDFINQAITDFHNNSFANNSTYATLLYELADTNPIFLNYLNNYDYGLYILENFDGTNLDILLNNNETNRIYKIFNAMVQRDFDSFINKILPSLNSENINKYMGIETLAKLNDAKLSQVQSVMPNILEVLSQNTDHIVEYLMNNPFETYSKLMEKFNDFDNNRQFFGNMTKDEYINAFMDYLKTDNRLLSNEFNQYHGYLTAYLKIDGLSNKILSDSGIIDSIQQIDNMQMRYLVDGFDRMYEALDPDSKLYNGYMYSVLQGQFEIKNYSDFTFYFSKLFSEYNGRITASNEQLLKCLDRKQNMFNEIKINNFSNVNLKFSKKTLIEHLSIIEYLNSNGVNTDNYLTLSEKNSIYNALNAMLLRNINNLDATHLQSHICNFMNHYAKLNNIENLKFEFENNQEKNTGGFASYDGTRIWINTKYFNEQFETSNNFLDLLNTIFHENTHIMQKQEVKLANNAMYTPGNLHGEIYRGAVNKYSLMYEIESLLRKVNESYYKGNNNYQNIIYEVDARYNASLKLFDYIQEIAPDVLTQEVDYWQKGKEVTTTVEEYIKMSLDRDFKMYEQNVTIYEQNGFKYSRDNALESIIRENPSILQERPILNYIFNPDGSRKTIFELYDEINANKDLHMNMRYEFNPDGTKRALFETTDKGYDNKNVIDMLNYWIENSSYGVDSLIDNLYESYIHEGTNIPSDLQEMIDDLWNSKFEKAIEGISENELLNILHDLDSSRLNDGKTIEDFTQRIIDKYESLKSGQDNGGSSSNNGGSGYMEGIAASDIVDNSQNSNLSEAVNESNPSEISNDNETIFEGGQTTDTNSTDIKQDNISPESISNNNHTTEQTSEATDDFDDTNTVEDKSKTDKGHIKMPSKEQFERIANSSIFGKQNTKTNITNTQKVTDMHTADRISQNQARVDANSQIDETNVIEPSKSGSDLAVPVSEKLASSDNFEVKDNLATSKDDSASINSDEAEASGSSENDIVFHSGKDGKVTKTLNDTKTEKVDNLKTLYNDDKIINQSEVSKGGKAITITKDKQIIFGDKVINANEIIDKFNRDKDSLSKNDLHDMIDLMKVINYAKETTTDIGVTISNETLLEMYKHVDKLLLNDYSMNTEYYKEHTANFIKYVAKLNNIDIEVGFLPSDSDDFGISKKGLIEINEVLFDRGYNYNPEYNHIKLLETSFHELFHQIQMQENNLATISMNSQTNHHGIINKYSLMNTIETILTTFNEEYATNPDNYKTLIPEIDARYNAYTMLHSYVSDIAPDLVSEVEERYQKGFNNDSQLYESNNNMYEENNIRLTRDAALENIIKNNPQLLIENPILKFIFNNDGTRKTLFELAEVLKENSHDQNIVNMINYWVKTSNYSIDSLINEMYAAYTHDVSILPQEFRTIIDNIFDNKIFNNKFTSTLTNETNYFADKDFVSKLEQKLANLNKDNIPEGKSFEEFRDKLLNKYKQTEKHERYRFSNIRNRLNNAFSKSTTNKTNSKNNTSSTDGDVTFRSAMSSSETIENITVTNVYKDKFIAINTENNYLILPGTDIKFDIPAKSKFTVKLSNGSIKTFNIYGEVIENGISGGAKHMFTSVKGCYDFKNEIFGTEQQENLTSLMLASGLVKKTSTGTFVLNEKILSNLAEINPNIINVYSKLVNSYLNVQAKNMHIDSVELHDFVDMVTISTKIIYSRAIENYANNNLAFGNIDWKNYEAAQMIKIVNGGTATHEYYLEIIATPDEANNRIYHIFPTQESGKFAQYDAIAQKMDPFAISEYTVKELFREIISGSNESNQTFDNSYATLIANNIKEELFQSLDDSSKLIFEKRNLIKDILTAVKDSNINSNNKLITQLATVKATLEFENELQNMDNIAKREYGKKRKEIINNKVKEIISAEQDQLYGIIAVAKEKSQSNVEKIIEELATKTVNKANKNNSLSGTKLEELKKESLGRFEQAYELNLLRDSLRQAKNLDEYITVLSNYMKNRLADEKIGNKAFIRNESLRRVATEMIDNMFINFKKGENKLFNEFKANLSSPLNKSQLKEILGKENPSSQEISEEIGNIGREMIATRKRISKEFTQKYIDESMILEEDKEIIESLRGQLEELISQNKIENLRELIKQEKYKDALQILDLSDVDINDEITIRQISDVLMWWFGETDPRKIKEMKNNLEK